MKDRLTIALDAKRLFHNREGLGTYGRMLLAELVRRFPQHTYLLCTPEIKQNKFVPDSSHPSVEIVSPRSRSIKSLWRSRGVITELVRRNANVYIGLSNELPFGIHNHIPSVAVIHDMLYKTFPQQFSLVDRWIYDRKFKYVAKNANHIIVTSNHTAKDLQSMMDVAPERVTVAYQPVSEAFRTSTPASKKGEHFLFVGTINERKNLKLIIKAMSLIPISELKPLVVVGRGKRYKREVVQMIEEAGLTEKVVFKENLSESELILLYNNALALIFPSRYEGFGRPILEALHLNVPVIATHSSSIPEVLGKYGTIIEHEDIRSLKEAMIKISNQGTNKTKGEELKSHLNKFSPETFLNAYLIAICKAIDNYEKRSL